MRRPAGELTTSFLSICGRLKDNRVLPDGFLSFPERVEISQALGAGADMAEDTCAVGVGDDPDYRQGGGDTLRYSIPMADLHGQPAAVEAVLYYQATPPFFLQDRFCTARGTDRDRLAYISAGMNFINAAHGELETVPGKQRTGGDRPLGAAICRPLELRGSLWLNRIGPGSGGRRKHPIAAELTGSIDPVSPRIINESCLRGREKCSAAIHDGHPDGASAGS